MGRGKKYQPEQVVNLLRQIEVAISNGPPGSFAIPRSTTYASRFQVRFERSMRASGLNAARQPPTAFSFRLGTSVDSDLIQVQVAGCSKQDW